MKNVVLNKGPKQDNSNPDKTTDKNLKINKIRDNLQHYAY